MKKKRCLLGCLNQIKMSFPRFVVGNLPLSKLLSKEEKQCCFNGKVEDPRQKHSGMTSLFYNGNNAFTLIELLVVVLIIGILAAVALPQYQKAVYKSRYATLKNLVNSISQAEEVYYLANGAYATDLEELSVEMPAGKLNTSTSERYNYDWGYCHLTTGMGDTIVLCSNSQINMQYQISLEHSATPGRRCTVLHSLDLSDIRNQICKAETGKTTYKASWAGSGNAHWWY